MLAVSVKIEITGYIVRGEYGAYLFKIRCEPANTGNNVEHHHVAHIIRELIVVDIIADIVVTSYLKAVVKIIRVILEVLIRSAEQILIDHICTGKY